MHRPGHATDCTPASTGSLGRPSPFLASTGITCGLQQLHGLPFIKRPNSRFAGGLGCPIWRPAMAVEVAPHPELRAVMDLFVKLMEHERRFVVLGVRASNRAQRLPPRICTQLMEHALPKDVGTFQDSDGFRCGLGAGSSRSKPAVVVRLRVTADSGFLRSIQRGAADATRSS